MTSTSTVCDDGVSDITSSESESTMMSEPTLYQPSPPDSDDELPEENHVENYVASTGESFADRMKHWLPTVEDIYPVQLAAVFKAGECINLNLLEKEPKRLLEVALKYKATVESLRLKGVISLGEMEKMKVLKHGSKDNKDVDIEVISGNSKHTSLPLSLLLRRPWYRWNITIALHPSSI